mmetsp:Transcript_53137/g.168710  ORF Transcript_53137/g.168710 Transcript_53137/m.168710 type:complete len:475 (-) Transcript_53137:203-1627(-)
MAVDGEIAKRLSFGDVSLHSPAIEPATSLLKAAREPSVENFRRALDDLNNANNRFAKLQDVAVEQSLGNSENDLSRVKSKFDRLKVDFQNIDVKENFIAAVKNGLSEIPDDSKLAENITAATIKMKELKAANDASRAEIESIIEQISEGAQGFEKERQALLDHLQGLAEEMAAHEKAKAEAAEEDDDMAQDTDDAIAAAVEEERELEKELAALEAEAASLEAEIAPVEQENQALRVQAEILEAVGGRARAAETEAARATESAEWASNMVSLLEVLGGCSVLSIGASSLHMVLQTHLPSHASAGHDAASGEQQEHEVTVSFVPGTVEVEGVSVEPADFPYADILAHAVGKRSLSFLVRELRARVQSDRARKAALATAREGGRFELRYEPGSQDLHVSFNLGGSVALRMPVSWPASGVALEVVAAASSSGAAFPTDDLARANAMPELAEGLDRALLALERVTEKEGHAAPRGMLHF